jgi:hypothetical protein
VAQSFSQVIRLIETRWPGVRSPATEEPVFLLAAGWRSGSTLLQRLLLKNCLVWGEPYGSSAWLAHLAQPLKRFAENWPEPHFFIGHPYWQGEMRGKWVANLYPELQDLLEAHLSFFRRLLGDPSRERGFQRWGLKEVRYGIEHACYLRWLFPRAKFLLLIRNPYECWASYRRHNFIAVRFWPEPPVLAPEQFGALWLELAGQFTMRSQEVGGLVVRYEEIIAPTFDPGPVQDYVGFPLDLLARDHRLGSVGKGSLSADEMIRLEGVVGPLAGRLGYSRLPG